MPCYRAYSKVYINIFSYSRNHFFESEKMYRLIDNDHTVNSNFFLPTWKPTLHINDKLRTLAFKPSPNYWVDAKVSADFFSFLCFKFLLKQNTINQQRIYHCYL